MTFFHVDFQNSSGNNILFIIALKLYKFFLILEVFVETTTAATSCEALLFISMLHLIFIPSYHSFWLYLNTLCGNKRNLFYIIYYFQVV